MTIPYERIIQWVAGPFAVLIGGLAAKWVSSWGFLGQLGLKSDSVAKGITAAVVFAVATGATILVHQKWMTNLAHWWVVNTAPPDQPKMMMASPVPLGPGDDQPNPTEWVATRQEIADANPVTDPMEAT
jgi:hypothetical protein